MKIPIAYYISSICFFTLWTLLFVNAVRHGMLRRYGWFYAFAGISAVGGAVRLIAVHVVEGGLDSWTFAHLFFATSLLEQIAALPLLWWLFRLDERPVKSGPLLLVALPAVGVFALSFIATESHVYYKTLNAGHCFLAFASFAVLLRRSATPELYLGRNCKTMLLSLFLLNLIPSFNFMLHFAEAWWWPLSVFRYLHQPVALAAWAIAFLGMRAFDPPKRQELLDQELIGKRIRQNLQIVKDSL